MHITIISTDRNITMSIQNQSKMRKILDTSNLLLSGSSPTTMRMTMMNPVLSDRSTMFMDPMISIDRSSSMFKSSASSESSDSLQTFDKLLSTKVSRRGRYKCSRCGELKVYIKCSLFHLSSLPCHHYRHCNHYHFHHNHHSYQQSHHHHHLIINTIIITTIIIIIIVQHTYR